MIFIADGLHCLEHGDVVVWQVVFTGTEDDVVQIPVVRHQGRIDARRLVREGGQAGTVVRLDVDHYGPIAVADALGAVQCRPLVRGDKEHDTQDVRIVVGRVDDVAFG